MNWIQFMKVDFRLTKKQVSFFIIFPIFVALIASSGVDMFFIISYLCFGVLVLSTTPFVMEDKKLSSFVQLLPGTDRDKVMGRYSWFLTLYLIFMLFGVVIFYIISQFEIGEVRIRENDYYFCLVTALVCLVIGCVQMAVFYLLGRTKSQQFFNIIRMVPALIFFMGSNYVKEHSDMAERVYQIVPFMKDNQAMMLLAGIAVVVFMFVICIMISAYFVSHRDIS